MKQKTVLDRLFAPLDLVFGGLDRFFRNLGRTLKVWIGEHLAFWLVLFFTGLYVIIEGMAKLLDRWWARLESVLLTVALLVMSGVMFLHAMEGAFHIGPEIQGAAQISLYLMVWVGFLGASVATRDGKHLAVDFAGRMVSPRARKFMGRFGAAVAMVFCFMLGREAWHLTLRYARFGMSVPSLQVGPAITGMVNLAQTLLRPVMNAAGGALNWFYPIPEDLPTYKANQLLQGLETIRSVTALAVDESTGTTSVPLWTAVFAMPLTFTVMGLRFGAQIFTGLRRSSDEAAPEAPILTPEPLSTARNADRIVAGLLPGGLIGLMMAYRYGPENVGWLIGAVGVLLLFSGVPLFAVLGLSTWLCVRLVEQGEVFTIISDMYTATSKEALLAIPFFVVAGAIMTEGSIAKRLIDIARAVLGKLPGGLAVAGIGACVFFAAISGSSPVTVIAIGTIMLPALAAEGYKDRFSVGLLTSAGSLGILIPPSIPMLIYFILAPQPELESGLERFQVADLFMAGVLPGLLIAGVLAVYTFYKNRDPVDLPEASRISLKKALKRGVFALFLPVLILGGIYSGLFTATSAAAVSVVYALIVELVFHRDLEVKKIPGVMKDSAVVMGGLFLIVVVAVAFNQFLAKMDVPQNLANWIGSTVTTKLGFLFAVNIFLLGLGCVMDIISAILIVVPLLVPVAYTFGIDPVHFAIIFIVNLEIGYLTPPLGLNLFVASTVFNRPIVDVIRSVIPFAILMLLCLAAITLMPWISLLLTGRL